MHTIKSPFLLLLLFPSLLLAAGCDTGDGNQGSADAGDPCATSYYSDGDGDGYGDDDSVMQACEAPTGYVARAGDCDDTLASVHPESAEVCDGSDNDCNGLVDSADPAIDLTTERAYFIDSDGDGYGAATTSMTSCDKPAGYAVNDEDCDDDRAAVNPGASEICDGLDNDCDSLYDDADDNLETASATSYYSDADGDGYGIGAALLACDRPSLYATQSGDCNDASSAVNPGETEICDGLDNDCDGGADGTSAAPNQCGAFPGVYNGSYAIRAQEKLGSTVINDMACNGSASITIDLSSSPAVSGTVTCQRVGGLILFDSTQTGTISGEIDLDGNISGRLVHTYNSDLVRSYNFSATLSGDDLDISGVGSVLPHPMAAVAWQVTYGINANR